MNIDINSIYDQIMYWVQLIGPLLAYIFAGICGIVQVVKYIREFGIKVDGNSAATNAKIEATNQRVESNNDRLNQLSQENRALAREVKRLCSKIDKIKE